jgi:hypothetical protein
VLEQLGVKRVYPAHDESRDQGLDQLPKFRLIHEPLH